MRARRVDNRSVRVGPAVFDRLLCTLVSYRPLATRFLCTRHATEHSLRDGCDPSSDLLLVFPWLQLMRFWLGLCRIECASGRDKPRLEP